MKQSEHFLRRVHVLSAELGLVEIGCHLSLASSGLFVTAWKSAISELGLNDWTKFLKMYFTAYGQLDTPASLGAVLSVPVLCSLLANPPWNVI